MNTHRLVGKSSANCHPFFANWIQLADPCQLTQTLMVTGFARILQLAKTPPPTT